jgi:hypothetical protein
METVVVNENVSDVKKTWWSMHPLKILIVVLIIVAVILFLIWFIIKTNTTPSENNTKMMKNKYFLCKILVPVSLSTSTPSNPCPISCSIHSHIPPVDLLTANISSLARDLSNCRYSSTDLVRWYLMRIDAVNRRGPHPLYAVIETNPDALIIAEMLDRQRQTTGPRSSFHGIPILVKDNVATNDKMQTTAGSLALVGSRVVRDAHVVDRLRQAGAIILGKASLSEWSNFRGKDKSREGWSPRGGPSR